MWVKLRLAAGGLAGVVALVAAAVAAPLPTVHDVAPIVVPATDFSAQGGGLVTVHPHGRGGSPAYIHEWCTPGHWLEWTIDGADAGDYQLVLRYGEQFQTARAVQINGQPIKGLDALAFPATGSWQTTKDLQAAVPIPLRAGNNILRITCLDSQSLWLYKINLTRGNKTLDIDPGSFTGQGGGRVQAIVSDEHGFFSVWDKRGQAFEWTIPNAAAGLYKLSLGCATRDVPRRELQVNGQVVKGFESFSVPWTGGWRSWCNEEMPGEVPLEAGRNVLRMTNLAGSLNLSYLRLMAPGRPEILINAIAFTAQIGGKAQIHPASPPFVDGWEKAGQWLEWKFNAPAAGSYTITQRYIGPIYTSQMESPADITVKPRRYELNGSVVKGLEAYMAPGLNDDWKASAQRDWQETNLPAVVTLKAGMNVLRITNLAKGPLTLYELRFTPVKNP